jgi:hypothetical protein
MFSLRSIIIPRFGLLAVVPCRPVTFKTVVLQGGKLKDTFNGTLPYFGHMLTRMRHMKSLYFISEIQKFAHSYPGFPRIDTRRLQRSTVNGGRPRELDSSHFLMDYPVPLTAVLHAFTLPTNSDHCPSLQSNDETECDFRDDRIFSLVDDADL